MRVLPLLALSAAGSSVAAQQTASRGEDPRIYGIIDPVSAERLEADITTLVSFGMRNSSSDTLSRWVGNVTEHTFGGIIIDNYFFGIAAVGPSGNESVVVFPGTGR